MTWWWQWKGANCDFSWTYLSLCLFHLKFWLFAPIPNSKWVMPLSNLMLLLICMLLLKLVCLIESWKFPVTYLRKICEKLNPAVRNYFIVLQNRLESRHLSTMGSCSGNLKSVNLSAKLYFPLWFPCNLAWWRCSLKARFIVKLSPPLFLTHTFVLAMF